MTTPHQDDISVPWLEVRGKPGADASPVRFVGRTASGPPASGTFATNDFVISADGKVHYCTAGGTPGTWASTPSGDGGTSEAVTLVESTPGAASGAGTSSYQIGFEAHQMVSWDIEPVVGDLVTFILFIGVAEYPVIPAGWDLVHSLVAQGSALHVYTHVWEAGDDVDSWTWNWSSNSRSWGAINTYHSDAPGEWQAHVISAMSNSLAAATSLRVGPTPVVPTNAALVTAMMADADITSPAITAGDGWDAPFTTTLADAMFSQQVVSEGGQHEVTFTWSGSVPALGVIVAFQKVPVTSLQVQGELTRRSAPVLMRHPWFEGIPQTIFGHSWPAADGHNTPRARSIDLIGKRFGLGPVMNHGRGGLNSVGITGMVLGNQHHGWTPNLKGIVWMHVGGNDMIQADMTIQANRDQLRREVESALCYLVSGQVIDSVNMSATGTWTNFTPVWPAGALGGSYRYSTSDNATDRLDATITGSPTKYAVHYIVTDDVGLPARSFTIHPNAGASVATALSGVFPTAANWPGNNGAGHSVYMNTHGSALTSMRMQNTTTEEGGSGTPAYVSIDGVTIPNLDTPPLIMVLADPQVVDYATAAERAAVKAEIDQAVLNVNTWMGLAMPCIYVVDLDDGWPKDNSYVGSDHLHPNDEGCRFIADKMENALLDWTEGKLLGQIGPPTEVPWKSSTSDAATLSHVQGSVNGQYYPIDRPEPAVANFTTSGTAEQIIHTFEIPACSVEPGDSYRISLKGYKTVLAGTLTCRLRVGTLNTISDAIVCASAVSTSIGTNAHAGQEIELTIRSIGVGGSIIGDMDGFAGSNVWPGAVAASAPVGLDTQPSPFYMHVTMQVSAGAYVKTTCSLEKKLGAQRIGF